MNKKGFTLLELLVVVLIIGILASIALPQYKKAVGKSKVSQTFIMLKSILQAEERYYLEHASYTNNLANLDLVFPKGTITTVWTGTKSATPNTYIYSCDVRNNGKFHGCVANAYNSNLPIIQFYPKVMVGISSRWCIAAFGKSKEASNTCEALGGIKQDKDLIGYDEYYSLP